jgi:hypothetical protein
MQWYPISHRPISLNTHFGTTPLSAPFCLSARYATIGNSRLNLFSTNLIACAFPILEMKYVININLNTPENSVSLDTLNIQHKIVQGSGGFKLKTSPTSAILKKEGPAENAKTRRLFFAMGRS